VRAVALGGAVTLTHPACAQNRIAATHPGAQNRVDLIRPAAQLRDVADTGMPSFRPPAVPLVTSDPYLSVWSEADNLTDDVTKHWTHRPHSLVSLIRIDGTPYRLMGNDPVDVPALPQVGLEVTPTRSIYHFANSQVKVTFTFMTPALPSDLNVLSRPVTYLTWTVQSADGAPHTVALYDSTSSQLAVNETDQTVSWGREKAGPLTALRVGSSDQSYLQPAGDDTRVNWGYAYAVAPTAVSHSAIGDDQALKAAFVSSGDLPAQDDTRQPRAVRDAQPVLAFTFNLGKVGAAPVSRHMMVGYDEVWSIDYFGRKLRPYWRRNGATPANLFQAAEKDYQSLIPRCESFDGELTADAVKVGGVKYAQLVATAYRECLAANGLAADARKQPLLFTKENTSNGDIATVDVIFPMDPIFVLLSPTLAKASLVSNFDYAASSHWKFPNAPHDLGTYPQVFGRDDGGEGMPVEESGNMIILTDAIAHDDGNTKFADKWWPQITQWAQYLKQYGLDPEDQLCTDDFMGHLAHNANLSVKAILALAAYGDLCAMRGDTANAQKYRDLAKADAAHWQKVADAGDHSLLAFDKPGTWSQKYNLVWDKILGLNVFPDDVAAKEIAYYKTVKLQYGVPLDSRTHLTKSDWSIWSATMATDKADFQAIVDPMWDYFNATTTRDPLADSFETDNIHSGGMHARPVVGGFFIRLLSDPAIWKKWASRDKMVVGNWAPLPKPPVITEVVPTGQHADVTWRYTTDRPAGGWTDPAFDDSSWKQGPAGLGTGGTPGITLHTNWNTDDIWARRTFVMPAGAHPNLKVLAYHDEDVEVYVNGVLATKQAGFVTTYTPYDISDAARKLLKPGATITLAVYCHQTNGGQGIDVGFADVTPQE
jgi:hypothetical protein